MKVHHTNEMWQKYVITLLAANPDWSTGYNRAASTGCRSNYYVYRPYDKFDSKLKNKRVEVMNYNTFQTIVGEYYERAKLAIIEGEVLSLGPLGRMHILRIQRNPHKFLVNHYKTKQYPLITCPETGRLKREKVVYYTDEDYCRVNWIKAKAIKHILFYAFCPTKNLKSNNGFNQLLSSAIKNSKTLRYKYIYKPKLKYNKSVT